MNSAAYPTFNYDRDALQFNATQYFRKSSRLDEFMSLGRVIREILERRDSFSRACTQ
jgi:hypothetical protein